MQSSTHRIRAAFRTATLTVVATAAAVTALALPASASAVTLVAPSTGTQYEWTTTRPSVAFDVATGEKPKWVLVASDAAMTQTTRYCRAFIAVSYNGGVHWGCNAWAVGVDAYGRDIIRPLTWGKTYYWQVVYTGTNGAERTTEVRSFAIKNQPATTSVSDISDQIWGTVNGDGNTLNTGAAAFVNSGVRVTRTFSRRITRNRFRIHVYHTGKVNLNGSYIRIKSRAGTRYVPLTRVASGHAVANWRRSLSEQRITPQRYEYQAFAKSTKNGALVRSSLKIIVIRTRSSTPTWTRTS